MADNTMEKGSEARKAIVNAEANKIVGIYHQRNTLISVLMFDGLSRDLAEEVATEYFVRRRCKSSPK